MGTFELLGISLFYVYEYLFIKNLYAPAPVESDPYWRAIYGVGEYSSEQIRKRKREEEEKLIQTDIELQNFDYLQTTQEQYDPLEIPIQVSNDTEAEDFIKQLQKEFGEEKLSLFLDDDVDDEKVDKYLDITDLHSFENEEIPDSNISNHIDGPQQWFVTVVGKEGPFLHVSDGKKKWIDVGTSAESIHINDDLLLTIEVEKEKFKVIDFVVLS